MTIRLNPYLSFGADARQAMEFYRSVFGGELTMTGFAEFGMAQDPADAEKVMHSQLTGPVEFMAADTPASMPSETGARISMSLFGGADDDAQLTGWFAALSEGGTVAMPLGQAPWGAKFGMCVDRFGVPWMVNIDGPAAE